MTDIPDNQDPGPDEERGARTAEYVLGTLAGADRTAFEAELARDPALRREVAEWAERLQPLADSVAAESPPAALRVRVMNALGTESALRPRQDTRNGFMLRWLAWTLGLSTLAGAVAAALVLYLAPADPGFGGYASLRNSKGAPGIVAFQIGKDHRGMVVLADVPAPAAGKDYELWVLPPTVKPISLGVVKAGNRETHLLPPAVAQYLLRGVAMAISLEPAGGAPGGAPTGPIMFGGYFSMVK